MPTPYEEMAAAALAAHLRDTLDAYDNGDAAGTVFAAASRALSTRDFEKFVKASRAQLARLEKRANGCPHRVTAWRAHYGEAAPVVDSD